VRAVLQKEKPTNKRFSRKTAFKIHTGEAGIDKKCQHSTDSEVAFMLHAMPTLGRTTVLDKFFKHFSVSLYGVVYLFGIYMIRKQASLG